MYIRLKIKIFIIILLIGSINTLLAQNPINNIKFVYTEEYLHTPMATGCTPEEFNWFDTLDHKFVKDSTFLHKFSYYLEKLEPDTNIYFIDARIMSIITYEGLERKDTLCFGEHHGIDMNGTFMKTDYDFLSLVKNKVWNKDYIYDSVYNIALDNLQKDNLSLEEAVFIVEFAQNPFSDYGYAVQMVTLTSGQFEESHDADRIVEIGDVRFDTKTGKIMGRIEEREVKEMDAQVVSRFISIDPHCERYYSISPYAYCKNNPVNRIDPDGKDDYRFSDLGQIHIIKGTRNNGSKTDRLFASNGTYIEVSDKLLLPGLQKNNGGDSNKRRFYKSTSNVEDAVKVFKFSADNTDREWKLDIYLDGDQKMAIVATDSQKSSVTKTDGYQDAIGKTKIVDIHSHPDKDGTKGGSATDLENADVNVKNSVYHKYDKTLYEYNSTQKMINSIPASDYQQILDYINNER